MLSMAMPAARPSQKTFYLDTSTLSDVYDAMGVGPTARAHPAYAALPQWVTRVSSEANLCISLVHLIEIARRPTSEADAMAAWLDSLSPTFVRPQPWVERIEDDRLVKCVMGATDVPVDPFTTSLLSLFADAWSPAQLADAMSDPTVRGAVAGIRRHDSQREQDFMPNWLSRLRTDRLLAQADGVSEQRLRERLAYNWRVGLRRRAGEAHNRLVELGDPEYLTTGAKWGDAMDEFVARFDNDPSELRSTAVIRAFSSGFESETAQRQPGSRSVSRDFGSSFWDLMHAAVGGAYCDVFTCDESTERCLGNVRQELGLSAPLARHRGEDPSVFVQALRATQPN